MKEIEVKDLNLGLLEKRTKAQLLQMICHVANVANDYTPVGTGYVEDRALSKLNLTRPRFKIRTKEPPPPEPPPVFRPKVGMTVRVVRGSTYWSPGKIGVVQSIREGGYEVKIRFQDIFNGETSVKDHTIWAEEVAAAESPANPS
jgi:hypothetical protein